MQNIIVHKRVSTLKDYLAVATIKEATGKESTKEMIKAVISDFELLVNDYKEAIHLAEEADDDVTADLFVGMKGALEKHLWMLKTTLK